jgi:hypothetical protein
VSAGADGGPPRPGPAHARLARFVGTWDTTGRLVDGPSGAAGALVAVDRYEWMPGGFFLLHHVDGRLGDAAVRALEVIGWDDARGAYRTWAFDEAGTAATYEARLDGRAWTIVGATERFAGTFDEAGDTLRGRWERDAGDGEWRPWMDVTLVRRAGAAAGA